MLSKIKDHLKEKSKGGGLFGFLGLKNEEASSGDEGLSFFEKELASCQAESPSELSYVENLKKGCSQKLNDVASLTEKEETFFDCTSYELSGNYFANLVENSAIAVIQRSLNAKKKTVAHYARFLGQLPDAL